MASVTAFNDMMGQFLVELHKTFPEEKGLKKCLSAFDLMKEANPRLVVDGFMNGVAPYTEQISAKDDSFFIKESKNLDFMKGVNLEKHWGSCSENTKNAIFQNRGRQQGNIHKMDNRVFSKSRPPARQHPKNGKL